ncbi:MAG TPA: hypothetical protein VJC11_02290 [Patescibacteria group bacterium]|nr:hypothetical protein [Patescibacteria group bacterium]
MSKFYFLAQKQIPTYADTVRVLHDEHVRLRIGLAVAASIFAMLILYIFFANSLASKNFSLKMYGEKIQEIKRDTARVEIEIAGKKSLEVLEAQSQALGLAIPISVEYVEAVSPLARK